MNLYTDDPTLGAASTPEDYQALSSGWALDSVAQQSWRLGGLDSFIRMAQQDIAGEGEIIHGAHGQAIRNPDVTPLLSTDEANARYGIAGALSWDQPVREGEAQLLNQWKHEELARNDALDRSTPGAIPAAARFLTGMAVSVADPVNLAASMVPVFGEARWAELAGQIGRPLTRLIRGGAEGLVGSALVEPITAAQQYHQQGDYDLDTALMDIAYGTIGGAGLRFFGGAAGDALSAGRDLYHRWIGTPAPAREAAFFDGVDALTEGRPVYAAEIAEPSRIFSATRQDRLLSSTTLTPLEREAVVTPEMRRTMAPLDQEYRLFDPQDAARQSAEADWEDRVEGAARDIEPEAWSQRDQLMEQQDQLRQQLETETATRDGGAVLTDLDAKIAYARGRMYDAPYRERRFYQDQINRLYAERDTAAGTKLRAADTPAMAEIRKQLVEADLKLRDLAPKITASLERGRTETPRPTPAEAALFDRASDGGSSLAGPAQRPLTLDDLMAETRGRIYRERTGEGGASDAAVGAEASRRADADAAAAVKPVRSREAAKAAADEAEARFRTLTGIEKNGAPPTATLTPADHPRPEKTPPLAKGERAWVEKPDGKFRAREDGTIDLGEVSERDAARLGVKAGPIRLTEGWDVPGAKPEAGDGSGVIHIDKRHGAEITKLKGPDGKPLFRSVDEFVDETLRDYNLIGSTRQNRLLLAKTFSEGNREYLAIVELSPQHTMRDEEIAAAAGTLQHGDFYTVRTAGVRRSGWTENKGASPREAPGPATSKAPRNPGARGEGNVGAEPGSINLELAPEAPKVDLSPDDQAELNADLQEADRAKAKGEAAADLANCMIREGV